MYFLAGLVWLFSAILPCGLVGLSSILSIAVFIFWLYMLIDAIKREEKSYSNQNDKLMWILILVLANWLGAALYYFMVYRGKEKGPEYQS